MRRKINYLTLLSLCSIVLSCCLCNGCISNSPQPHEAAVRTDEHQCNFSGFISSLPDSVQEAINSTLDDNRRWWSSDLDVCNNGNQSLPIQYQDQHVHLSYDWCTSLPQCPPCLKGIILNRKALYHLQQTEPDSACNYFKEAYDVVATTTNQRLLLTITLNLGNAYYYCGNVIEADRYFKKAVHISEQLHTTEYLAAIRIGLAQINNDLRNFHQAQKYLDAARPYLSKNAYEQYYYYTTRGISYFYEKDYNKAYAIFNIALDYAHQLGEVQTIMTQACLGEIALMKGNKELALSHIQPCINYMERHTDTKNQTQTFYIGSLTAHVLLANGYIQQSHKILDKLPETKTVRMMRCLSMHFSHLSNYAKEANDFKKAFEYLVIAQKYKDTINNTYATNSMLEMGKRYQRDTTQLRQQYTIANTEADMSQYQLRLTIIIFGLLLVIAVCVIMLFVVRHLNEKRYHVHVKQISQLRMDVVRNRISPHYIFNVLGMMLPKFKADPELNQLSELFIDVIRGSLLASNQMSIEFLEEKRLVNQYISLYHKTRSPYPIINWHDATNGEVDHINVPTMCLQIPIENALKHAFDHLDEKSAINIYIMEENERIMIRIIDNGKGYDPGKVTSTGRDTGTGLRVLARTFALLNNQNPHPIEFIIKNLSSDNICGTEVKISIPFNYNYEYR